MNQPRQKKHKKLVTAILLAGLLMIEGWMYYNHYSYSHQLNVAEKNLLRLESQVTVTQRLQEALSASILDSEGPKKSNPKDATDGMLSNLATKAVKSTERALKNVDDTKDTHALSLAIDEILSFQDHQISVLKKISETLVDPEAIHEMNDAISRALTLQEKTIEARSKVDAAIAENQKTLEIVIIQEKKHHNHSTIEDTEPTPEESAEVSTFEVVHQEVQTMKPIDANEAFALEQKAKDAAQREANRQRILLIQSAQKT